MGPEGDGSQAENSPLTTDRPLRQCQFIKDAEGFSRWLTVVVVGGGGVKTDSFPISRL